MVNAQVARTRGGRAKSPTRKQLTVRGVDPALEEQLRQEAGRRGRSVNQTVLELLRQAAGLESAGPPAAGTARFTDLDHLAGTWSDEEARDFDQVIGGMRRVDPDLWP